MPDEDSSEGEVEFTGEDEETFTPRGNADDADDDDDKPLSNLGKRASRGAPVSYAEQNYDDEEEEDDDDDIPLASLVQNKKKTTPTKKTTNGSKQTKKATSPKKKAKTTKATTATNKTSAKQKAQPKKSSSTVSTSASSKNYEWASAAFYGTESVKGLLIQRLLCRWWYAIAWPDPTKLPAKPPKYYDALDGFPGVYVCTSAAGDEAVGHILDLRKGDDDSKPCFDNFAKKPALELQELLLKALENQLTKLQETEGPGTSTEKELQGLIKWTKKVNPTKADKDAIKVLKGYNLDL